MSRPHRQDHAGALHFITNRGTAQTLTYRSDRDRRFFLWLLSELHPRFDVRVFAYVLMGDHYHLIVRSDGGRLSEAMRFLDGTYARWFNSTHDRTGALWQGRYDDRIISTEIHRERAGIYLHLNPLRARLVGRASDYRWSSLGAYAAGRSTLQWLELDLLDGRTGDQYLAVVLADVDEVLALGEDDDSIHAWCSDLDIASDAAFQASDQVVAGVFGVSVDELYVVVRGRSNVPRMAAIAHAVRSTGLPITAIAYRYGLRTADSVQSAVRRLRIRADAEPGLALRLEALALTGSRVEQIS